MVVVSTVLPWDAVLDSLCQQMLERDSRLAPRVREMRRHVEEFHKSRWPQIQSALQKEQGIIIPDELEPHWTEAWKAAFWKPSTDLAGNTTWTLTGGLPADVSTITYNFNKGWKTRQPTEEELAEVEAALGPLEEEWPPLSDAGLPLCTICGYDFGTTNLLITHQKDIHGRIREDSQ